MAGTHRQQLAPCLSLHCTGGCLSLPEESQRQSAWAAAVTVARERVVLPLGGFWIERQLPVCPSFCPSVSEEKQTETEHVGWARKKEKSGESEAAAAILLVLRVT